MESDNSTDLNSREGQGYQVQLEHNYDDIQKESQHRRQESLGDTVTYSEAVKTSLPLFERALKEKQDDDNETYSGLSSFQNRSQYTARDGEVSHALGVFSSDQYSDEVKEAIDPSKRGHYKETFVDHSVSSLSTDGDDAEEDILDEPSLTLTDDQNERSNMFERNNESEINNTLTGLQIRNLSQRSVDEEDSLDADGGYMPADIPVIKVEDFGDTKFPEQTFNSNLNDSNIIDPTDKTLHPQEEEEFTRLSDGNITSLLSIDSTFQRHVGYDHVNSMNADIDSIDQERDVDSSSDEEAPLVNNIERDESSDSQEEISDDGDEDTNINMDQNHDASQEMEKLTENIQSVSENNASDAGNDKVDFQVPSSVEEGIAYFGLFSRKLKSELHQLRKKGAVKAGGEDSGDEKVCHRCRKELGFIFDSGEICPKCNNKVCNDCQVFTPSGKKWLCTVCDKQLQIKLGSPNWVGEKSDEVQSLPSLHGSQLVKVSLENSRATSAVTSVVDESEDTKRYYEDDLSYTDEESESYGSGEQDQNKSPERNVTFDSPLRQSAVPSDLGQGSQGDSKQMVFSNSSETLLHKHWHARSPGSGHRVFCTSVTPKSNVVLSYQHLNSSDEIYQKDVPSTSFIELPNFSIFRKVPVRQVKAQTQPFLRTSGPKASSGENGAISGSIHNTGILDDEIDNSSDLDSSEIEKVEELSDVDDTPVSVSTQTEPIDFCKGNIYLDGTVQEVDAPRAFMDYVVLDKVEKALVYYTEDVVNNHHPKKRKLSCDLVSDDEEVTALLRQSSASERGTVKIREWNFLPVLQSRERQKLVPSEPHLFVPVSRARPLTDSDPSSSTESSPVNLVECQSPSSSDCSLDLDEKLSANKRLVESLLQENTKIGNVATGEHVMKGGLVVEALMQKRFEGHSYVDTSSHINSSEHLSPDLSKVSPKKQLKAPNIDFTDFVEEEDLMESSDIWNGPDAVFMAYRTSQASSESDLSVIIEDPEEEKTTQKTVSEESEEEEEDEDVSRSTTEHHRDDFPVPYTQQYRTQKVEADVHSNEENGSYSPPAPKQKQIIDTTPNLKGDEWEQMLNGRLKDASEKEEGKEEQVTDLTSVKMEKKEQIIQQSEEQEDKVINNDKEAADEADEKGAVGDSVKETIEDEHEKVDKVKRDVSDCGTDGLKVEEDYDDAELVVINYSDGTNEGSESREVKPVLIKEEEEGKENADLKVEMADESCQSQRNDDHGTQTEGETVDVHVDVTDDMSHTMSVKSNTSQLEPYGMDGESHSISRRNTGGTLSKVNRDDFKKASRASLVSLYSNAEESYRLQVTGDVNFGTSYNYKTNTFQVKIVSCRDLVPVDTKRNRSNPYVKLYLLPDRSKHSKRKTHVSKSTINPVYSETLKYKIRQSELETRTLCVAVWHYDRFGHNLFLGEHLLSLDTVQFDDYSAKWHPLAQRQHRSTTALTYTGDVLVAIMYEPLSEDEEKDRTSRYHKGRKNKPPGRLVGGTLHVHIKEAKNLVGMKLGGSSSPICKCYLLPDKTKHGKKKTAVKRNTCNPKWTDILKFDNVTRDSLLERCLEVTVWDFDSVGSNSLMGGVRLGLGSGKSYGKAVDWMDSSGKEVSVWREMLKHPNHWVETTMTLRGDVGKAKK